jgi:Cu/Ag efflux pump CusA
MSRFFIRRPVVAIVIAIITVLGGLVAMQALPIAQFPEIVPPQITVTATYNGADALTIEQAVAAPLEQQMNGVDNMLYMQSTNANDTTMQLVVTFDVDTDPNIDQVNVQNRVAQAQPNLPPDVNTFGLTSGSGGVQSAALSALFTTPAGLWVAGAGLTQSIFNAGRTRSTVALSKAQQEEAVLAYQQTIQQSLREVSDALVGYRKGRDFREQQQLLNRAATDARRLADIRYRGGATSYLEVLDSDTRMFSAEIAVTQAELSELLSLVQVYRALGGGWQP